MTTRRRRLDSELVRRNMATGRDQAKRLIDAGDVLVNGATGTKAATLVTGDAVITLRDGRPTWASRGGFKLDAALRAFDVDPSQMRALDIGASTGGFTDVLLSHGAATVTAVDVGYGQLIWRLRQDDRVTVVDRTNFRTLDVAELDPPFDLVVVDVSFISVTLLASNLAAAGADGTEYVVLVKPQFEAGKDRVGTGGIVTDPSVHRGTIRIVCQALADHQIAPVGLIPSPITGTKGNVEFLVHGRLGAPTAVTPEIIEAAVAGP